MAGSVAVASLLFCSSAKTDGVIKRWSALSALVMRPHSTAQASNGRFVTAETAVHSQAVHVVVVVNKVALGQTSVLPCHSIPPLSQTRMLSGTNFGS